MFKEERISLQFWCNFNFVKYKYLYRKGIYVAIFPQNLKAVKRLMQNVNFHI